MKIVCRNQDENRPGGMTVVELVVAMALMVVVMGAVMPLLAGMRNGSDTQRAQAEMIQNGRVLNEHLLRHLGQAVRVVRVSAASETDGYIEFEDANGVTNRYDVGAGDYVQFGPAGDLSDLAGPVSSLQFVCYDANDLAHSKQEPAAIRFVTWEATLRSAGSLTRDRTVNGACYLRANGNVPLIAVVSTYDCVTRRPEVDMTVFADEGKPQLPNTVDTPSEAVGLSDYDAVACDDSDFHLVSTTSISAYAQLRLAVQIDEIREEVTGLSATWTGKGTNGHASRIDGASLCIWNYSAGAYEVLDTSPNTEMDVTLTGSVAEVPANYIGGVQADTVVLLAVSADKMTAPFANELHTDYVKLDVTTMVEADDVLP